MFSKEFAPKLALISLGVTTIGVATYIYSNGWDSIIGNKKIYPDELIIAITQEFKRNLYPELKNLRKIANRMLQELRSKRRISSSADIQVDVLEKLKKQLLFNSTQWIISR